MPQSSGLISLQASRAVLKVGSQLLEFQLPTSGLAAPRGSVAAPLWPRPFGEATVSWQKEKQIFD